MGPTLQQKAVEKLSLPPSATVLLEFIRWLDLECAGAACTSLQEQILVRAVVATGHALVQQRAFPPGHPVFKTVAAAEAYLLDPTEERFEGYFEAATASYPFGSGEGCYAVSEIGRSGCEPGSGCVSGAGSLYSVAQEIGIEAALQSLAQELIPWLRGGNRWVKERILSP